MSSYRALVTIFGVVALAIGVALLVETAVAGGGVGYVIGVLFIALGAGRLYLLRRRRG
jgi:uncharacterized membrane protein HdeD (DUF308 family)